jgi:hypothetical protein
MKTHAVLVAVLLMLGAAPATATVMIANDTGGQIGPYLAKYRALRASGERVEIDGTCASACTMLLGIIPRNRICLTPRASLVFHSAWDMEGDQRVTSDGNRILWSTYPESVRRWIKSHGGLHSETITLSGPELADVSCLPVSFPIIQKTKVRTFIDLLAARFREVNWSDLHRRGELARTPCT